MFLCSLFLLSAAISCVASSSAAVSILSSSLSSFTYLSLPLCCFIVFLVVVVFFPSFVGGLSAQAREGAYTSLTRILIRSLARSLTQTAAASSTPDGTTRPSPLTCPTKKLVGSCMKLHHATPWIVTMFDSPAVSNMPASWTARPAQGPLDTAN